MFWFWLVLTGFAIRSILFTICVGRGWIVIRYLLLKEQAFNELLKLLLLSMNGIIWVQSWPWPKNSTNNVSKLLPVYDRVFLSDTIFSRLSLLYRSLIYLKHTMSDVFMILPTWTSFKVWTSLCRHCNATENQGLGQNEY